MPESQFVTYAQNGEDVLLWRALKHVRRGFYIDVGAQDPIVDSVTKAFYDRGWRGINIEPVRHWYERLVEQRTRDVNLRVAASDHDGGLKLCASEDSGLSTSNESFARMASERGWKLHEILVPCTTLSKICTEHVSGPVHFLKIDCEGAEAAALRGMQFGEIRPWIVLVEATEPNSAAPTYAQWEPDLTAVGYDFVYSDGINRYYVAVEHAELRAAFTFPPNALDDYIHASELRARELQREAAGLQTELDGQGVEVARLQREYLDVSENLARIRFDCNILRADLADHVEAARAQSEEILRLQREYRAISGELADLRRERRALEENLALETGVARARATEISRLQLEYREITEAREAMRIQLSELQYTLDAACVELAAMQASRSWRLTAPFRVMCREAGKAIRAARRAALGGLRPVARALRPALRKLAKIRVARKWMVGTLGKDTAIIRHGRLFLFGPPPSAVSDTDITELGGVEASSLSRRERIVLFELQRALKSSSGDRRDV